MLRSKRVRTTRREEGAGRHPDLVGRQFTASEPNQLWVTDLTFVATWAGVAYVCFIVDAFSRMIVGWRVAGHMRTPMVLDAIEMARWNRAAPLRAALPLRRRIAVHVHSLRRTARGDRRDPVDRHGRRQLWQRAGRDRQRLLQGRADPRPCPHRPVEDRRGGRARHARLGALAQHPAPARLPRRPAASRVRAAPRRPNRARGPRFGGPIGPIGRRQGRRSPPRASIPARKLLRSPSARFQRPLRSPPKVLAADAPPPPGEGQDRSKNINN